jgi:hypothetical protein
MNEPDDRTAEARETGRAPDPTPPVAPGTDDVVAADRAAGDTAAPAEDTDSDSELSAAVAALTDEDLDRGSRSRLLGRVIKQGVRDRGIKELLSPKGAVRWVADAVMDAAPRISVRDRATLREHHNGLDGDALAERLVRNAARVSAGIGMAGGGVAAVEWTVTPTLLSTPVLLAAETVAVVAVEIKLIAELHEAYGRPVPGNGAERATVLLQAWANQRGVNPLVPGRGVAAVLGTTSRKDLRERLVRRLGRNLTMLGPFLTGAAVAGYLNRRSTLSLGEAVRNDLRTPKVIEAD